MRMNTVCIHGRKNSYQHNLYFQVTLRVIAIKNYDKINYKSLKYINLN